MQGKLIAVAYTLRTYCNKFPLGGICKQILIRGGEKHLILIILKMHIIVTYDQNISLIIFVKIDSMSGCDIRLVFNLPPKDSTLQYTSEITFLALVPWSGIKFSNVIHQSV